MLNTQYTAARGAQIDLIWWSELSEKVVNNQQSAIYSNYAICTFATN